MCKADFIKYKTSECPSYERVNTDTAEQQWNKLFVSPNMRKDQVEACSERGESIGKVWRLWIPIGESEVSSKYEDYGVQQQIGDNASKPSESEVSLQREKAEGLLKSCLLDDDGGAPHLCCPQPFQGPVVPMPEWQLRPRRRQSQRQKQPPEATRLSLPLP